MSNQAPMSTAEILRKSAQAIRDLGFAKFTRHAGQYEVPERASKVGAVCALGAIEIATGDDHYVVNRSHPAVIALAAHLPSSPFSDDYRVVNWNNLPVRTADEVIATFEAAAACEEHQQKLTV